jgi:regulator of sigma E protease
MTNQFLSILLLSAGWIKFFQFFIALSILILLHEWGHYYAARRTGTRVEKFYLFFDFLFPVSTWLPFSLFKKKVGDTEYGIGWFPMGGYVKIAGMIDESMDKDAMAKPAEPWEFRSKTAPQRLLIMLGGIIMNVLLAIVVYIVIFSVWGEDKLPYQNLKNGIACDSLGYQAGFQDGDIPMAINGKEVTYYEDFKKKFIFEDINKKKNVTVIRNSQKVTFDIPDGTIDKMVNNKESIFSQRVPFVVDSIDAQNSYLNKNDFQRGDQVIAVNGKSTMFFDACVKELGNVLKYNFTTVEQAKADFPAWTKKLNTPLELKLLRNQKDTITLSAKLKETGLFGIAPIRHTDTLTQILGKEKTTQFEHINYNPLAAIPRALSATWKNVTDYKDNLKAMFTSKEIKASKSLGGFGSFASIFPEKFEMQSFLGLLAFISVMLAFMNLLPIPGLDGGYVMFLIYEMITGKEPNQKVMETATSIGLMLLLALMLYANGLDILRALHLV